MEVSLYNPGTRENNALFSVFDNGDLASKMIAHECVKRSAFAAAARGRITAKDNDLFVRLIVAWMVVIVNAANASAS